MGEIYAALGLLEKGHVIEVDRGGLVGRYIGETAIKTTERIKEAIDGILFIDEAYALAREGHAQDWDYGQEALETLLKAMEDSRDRLAVIVAGYRNHMQRFIEATPGLRSRFTRYIEFPDYGVQELTEIFVAQCLEMQFTLNDQARLRVEELIEAIFANRSETFGNARAIRTLFEKAMELQAARLSTDETADPALLLPEDIP
jgi:stage V sporulation protein K